MASQVGSPPLYNAPTNAAQYALNSKIMVAAIVVLFVVVFFILGLHVYAKWFWRHSSALAHRRTPSWRRRHRLGFTVEEPFVPDRSVGLDKAVVDALPVFVYKPPAERGGQEAAEEEALLECAVCLSEFEENEKGRVLPNCKHSFHTKCIDMWFHSHSTCPLCRTPVLPEAVLAQAAASDPFYDLQRDASGGGHHHYQQQQGASLVSSPPPASALLVPSTISHGNTGPHPGNALFWGDHPQLRSHLSSPVGSSSTRSLPPISIDIPARHPENLAAAPRCSSLSLSRCPSAESQACSSSRQALKSPSFKQSIRRLLSRERSRGRRVFPSGQQGVENEQDTIISPV